MPRIALPLVLVLGTFGCAANGGVPAPDFTTPFDAVAPESIQTYLGKLQFDDREGPGDVQFLVVGCPAACRVGPEVAIQPEKRNYRNSKESLMLGPGRIIARFINHDLTEGYPALNLAPGDTVFWAVDRVKPVDRNRSTGRSLYISLKGLREKSKSAVKPGSLRIQEHPDKESWKQSLARWVPTDSAYADDHTPGGGGPVASRLREFMAWGGCRSQSCCGP
jgi:hypothetical protein